MNRWLKYSLIFLSVFAAALTASAALGGMRVTHTIPTKGITEFDANDGHVTIVQDGRDELVVRTTWRRLPWLMLRQNGTTLNVGNPDDQDPRMYLALLGNGAARDSTTFELHTTHVPRLYIEGDADLFVDRLAADSLTVVCYVSSCSLKGLDVGRLQAKMFGDPVTETGTMTVAGTADTLDVKNMGACDFDGSKLVVGAAESVDARSKGKTIINVDGIGPKVYTPLSH